MKLCIFEDNATTWLEPLTLTRPAFELRCGATTLLERQRQFAPTSEVALAVRPHLVEHCQVAHPNWDINDTNWFRSTPAVLINARWLPPRTILPTRLDPHVGVIDGQVAYVVTDDVSDCEPHHVDEWLEHCKRLLPHRPAEGVMMSYPWDLVAANPEALCEDRNWFAATRDVSDATGIAVVGDPEQVVIAKDANVEPYVVADATNGPVMIDRRAHIHAFTRLEGPCYVGEDCQILGAKLRGGTLGPHCRIGGEFEASIVQGFTNKYHDGFVGHSYLGEWVNLAAGTQISDLRNDYGQVRVFLHGERIATGQHKVGAFIGDHSKTGLNATLNTGTVIGAFCNVLPTGMLGPQVVPSFSMVRHGYIQERTDLRQLLNTAAKVLSRRGRELTGAQIDLIFTLYEQTNPERRRVLRESEMRHLRRSV